MKRILKFKITNENATAMLMLKNAIKNTKGVFGGICISEFSMIRTLGMGYDCHLVIESLDPVNEVISETVDTEASGFLDELKGLK